MPTPGESSAAPAASAAVRQRTARAVRDGQARLATQNAVLGFDGFVDEIVRLVDKRESFHQYSLIPNLAGFSRRVAECAGKSTNLELVVQQVKIGGNGPIMADALAAAGVRVTYIGMLGTPDLHPVFHDFARRNHTVSIANPGHTDALEFEDGKLMLGKLESTKEVTWERLLEYAGFDTLQNFLEQANLLALVNWTMLPYMSDIWRHLLGEICPRLSPANARRILFFDLADPEKRLAGDIRDALQLVSRFEEHFHTVLGINEKESLEIAGVLDLTVRDDSPQALLDLATALRHQLGLTCVVIHPRAYAVAAHREGTAMVAGPFALKPLISTGAGDHFNAGFCLGLLLDQPLEACLLTGVSSSGFYVRNGRSPKAHELADFLENWPA